MREINVSEITKFRETDTYITLRIKKIQKMHSLRKKGISMLHRIHKYISIRN